MSKMVTVLIAVLMIATCTNGPNNNFLVHDLQELQAAIKKASPGDEIVMAKGVWQDVEIKFQGTGTLKQPIVLRAEIPGEVSIEGQSSLQLAGEYLVVKDLYFRNGFTPSNSVIEFRIDKDQVANHSSIVNCVIDGFTQKNRFTSDHWVEFWGRHNSLEFCSITGKANNGPTVRVYLKGNKNIRNYHRIVNNYFGPRPRKGGPHGETMQIGDSGTSMTPSYVFVENNLFDRCNGEVEVISSKSNFNEFRNNVFYHCEGSLVMRHGNYCVIDGNYFIGDENSQFNGGVRIINTGHSVTNNYFYRISGIEFRSPLAIMNGIPKSPLNRYNQVTDVVVAYNTWIDCKAPWQLGVGANMDKRDILPKSEIRSARPIRTILANNIIYNRISDPNPVQAYDKVDGIKFRNNLLDNAGGVDPGVKGIVTADLRMEKLSEWMLIPTQDQGTDLSTVFPGFEFDKINKDISGNSRQGSNSIGAMVAGGKSPQISIITANYGAVWYPLNAIEKEPVVSVYTPGEQTLQDLILEADDGDIIELPVLPIEVTQSIPVDKRITIRGKTSDTKGSLIYSGPAATPLFRMLPRGELILENMNLRGEGPQLAFETAKKNMSPGYNLWLEKVDIQNFETILQTYRGSFADTISVNNSVLTNCRNGMVLAAELDDKGDYNAASVTIRNSRFENIDQNILNYYRGGYDESTIGGVLLVEDSEFQNCGSMEQTKILLKTRGIINVDIRNNLFKNNPVKLVALLWGAKNNSHSGNEIQNSGSIRVEEQLKQKLMY